MTPDDGSAAAARGRRPDRFRLPAIASATAALVGLAALAGCAQIDEGQAKLCRSALPALLPDRQIRIVDESRDPLARFGVAIAYEFEDGGGGGSLRCGFGGGRLDDRRLDLRDVEIDGHPLPDASLLFLRRFYLSDRDAVAAGERFVHRPSPSPIVPMPVGSAEGYFAQQVVNAVPLGAIYAMIALAYALVYGLIGRINLAFGQIAVIGAFVLVNLMGFLAGLTAQSGTDVALIAALSVSGAAVAAAAAGAATSALVFRPLSSAPHRPFLIATIGLAVALGEALRLIAGSRDAWIQPLLNEPRLLLSGGFDVTGTAMQALETAVAAVSLFAVAALMARTGFGLSWRAVADDPPMARMLGVDTRRVAAATFVLSAAVAGIAGGLTALHYGHASPYSGMLIGLKALVAALLGGIGSLTGAALGGLAIGLIETFWSAYLPLANRDIAVLAIMVVVLVFKPDGLFGRSRAHGDTADLRWMRQG